MKYEVNFVNVVRNGAFDSRHSMYLAHKADRKIYVVTDFVFTEYKENESPADAPIKLTADQMQYLMDRLWDCGIRPTEGTGSAGSLAAVKYHLEDMRKLVFKV